MPLDGGREDVLETRLRRQQSSAANHFFDCQPSAALCSVLVGEGAHGTQLRRRQKNGEIISSSFGQRPRPGLFRRILGTSHSGEIEKYPTGVITGRAGWQDLD